HVRFVDDLFHCAFSQVLSSLDEYVNLHVSPRGSLGFTDYGNPAKSPAFRASHGPCLLDGFAKRLALRSQFIDLVQIDALLSGKASSPHPLNPTHLIAIGSHHEIEHFGPTDWRSSSG